MEYILHEKKLRNPDTTAPLACSNYGNGNWKKKIETPPLPPFLLALALFLKTRFIITTERTQIYSTIFYRIFFFRFVLIKSRYTIHIINPLSVLFLIHQLVLSTPVSISFACDVYFNLLFQLIWEISCLTVTVTILSCQSQAWSHLIRLLYSAYVLFYFFRIHCCWHVTCCCKKFFCLVFRWVTYTLWYSVQTSYMDKCNPVFILYVCCPQNFGYASH